MKRKLNYSKSHSDLKSHKARIQHYHEDKGKTPGLLLFHSNTQLSPMQAKCNIRLIDTKL